MKLERWVGIIKSIFQMKKPKQRFLFVLGLILANKCKVKYKSDHLAPRLAQCSFYSTRLCLDGKLWSLLFFP